MYGHYYHAMNIKKSNAGEAVAHFESAVAQGFHPAMYQLALCFINGKGVLVNEQRAIELHERAGRLHNRDALYALGNYHAKRKSMQISADYYRQAAELYAHSRMFADQQRTSKRIVQSSVVLLSR
jgi:TPR repeat protein